MCSKSSVVKRLVRPRTRRPVLTGLNAFYMHSGVIFALCSDAGNPTKAVIARAVRRWLGNSLCRSSRNL